MEKKEKSICSTCKNCTFWTTKFGDIREGCKVPDNDKIQVYFENGVCSHYEKFQIKSS